MKLLTLADIQAELGVGRRMAERLARESGLLLPRIKNGPYIVPRDEFFAWIGGRK